MGMSIGLAEVAEEAKYSVIYAANIRALIQGERHKLGSIVSDLADRITWRRGKMMIGCRVETAIYTVGQQLPTKLCVIRGEDSTLWAASVEGTSVRGVYRDGWDYIDIVTVPKTVDVKGVVMQSYVTQNCRFDDLVVSDGGQNLTIVAGDFVARGNEAGEVIVSGATCLRSIPVVEIAEPMVT